MVTGKFSPKGGIGKYTSDLVQALRKDIDVNVICEKSNTVQDNEIYKVIQPGNYNNSDEILRVVRDTSPNLVHVQYEPSLFESASVINSRIRGSTLKKFYSRGSVPTVTTLHSIIPHDEYIGFYNEAIWKEGGKFGFLPLSLRAYVRRLMIGKRYMQSFEIAKLSDEVINASRTSYDLLGWGKIIYNAAEPAFASAASKQDLRREFNLPPNKMLLLATGYADSAKGFDILSKLNLPEGWAIVIKQTKNAEQDKDDLHSENIINLPSAYLDYEHMSKLIYACDSMIIPRKFAGSSSAVLFEGLAHGLPFVATNLKIFKEFADMGLGVIAERDPQLMSDAIRKLASSYHVFKQKVEEFIPQIRLEAFALKHVDAYSGLLSTRKVR